MADEGDASPFRYHLELNPRQLKVTHTALRALRDDFGHDEAEVHALVEEVLSQAAGRARDPRDPARPRAAGREEILAEPPAEATPADPPSRRDRIRPTPDPGQRTSARATVA